MDELTTAQEIAQPLGEVAANFYFSPFSVARAEAIGLDVVSLYGAGRGGVVPNATPEHIDEIFTFFKPGMIAGIVARGRSLAENSDIVAAHLGAADDYAEASFAGLSPSVVTAFSEAAEKVAFAAPSGKWPLFDGYVAAGTPASLAARAYRGAISLRELRGGVHTDAVRSAGLSPSVACQFDRDDFYFQMHGFGDDDKVEFTEAIEAMKRSVEDATNAAMAQLLGVLSDEEREALVVGTTALAEALR